jgi:predicted acyl esterase
MELQSWGRTGTAASAVALFMLLFVALTVGAADADAAKKKKKGYAAPAVTSTLDAKVRGSIKQVYVQDAEPETTVLLVNPNGRVIRTAQTDAFGSKIFREVRPKWGYRVLQPGNAGVAGSRKMRSLKPGDNPKQSYYDKLPPLQEGLNYVTMRDGVKIAMTLRLPIGKDIDDGPFPTVIEHSGYGTAAPGDLLASLIGGSDPLAPDSATVIGSALAPLLGYASVSMQMRGSGCSAGAYDLFGQPTTYDGYDAIETVGAQDWSKGKVGLAGISYSGTSQMFTAGTRPPHLGAIAPMSITTDIYEGTGYPGGIFNSGFALSWISDRVRDAQPAPEGGQRWAREMINNQGDTQCLDNQKLRLQTLDVFNLIETNPNRTPLIFNQRAPGHWMKRIQVPVFLTGQYQDEQTGGNFPTDLPALNKNKNVWISMQNGVHTDSISPSTITQWIEFMDVFVAKRVPEVPALFVGPGSLFSSLLGGLSDPIVQSEYVDLPSASAAEKAFRKDNPRVRLLMDNGAGPSGPGGLGATWELDYNSWPPKNVKPRTWYLGDEGSLNSKKQSAPTTEQYTADPDARPSTNLASGGVNPPQPDFNWAPVSDGKGLGFVSSPLAIDTVIAGGSSLTTWLKSSAPDTDLQVSLSEIRPDGKETYVQTGWLRASHRKLKKNGREPLNIKPTHLAGDQADLPAGKFSKVRVPIFPVVHAFRAGSAIRVTIMAPGGDRSEWEFRTIDDGSAENKIAIGGNRPSSLILPVLNGTTAKGTPLPTAGSLRAQPTREYETASNGG